MISDHLITSHFKNQTIVTNVLTTLVCESDQQFMCNIHSYLTGSRMSFL